MVAKCGKMWQSHGRNFGRDAFKFNQRLGSSLSLCIEAFWAIAAIAFAIRKSNMARQLFLGGFNMLQYMSGGKSPPDSQRVAAPFPVQDAVRPLHSQ